MDAPALTELRVEVFGANAQTCIDRIRASLPEATVVESPGPDTRPRDRSVIVVAAAPVDWGQIATLSSYGATVVISDAPSAAQAALALDVGAAGYLDAHLGPSALRSALIGVTRGELAFRREHFGAWLTSRHVRREATPPTSSERRILELISHGATDKEIAQVLGIRPGAAQRVVAAVLRRLGARNRAAAVAITASGRH